MHRLLIGIFLLLPFLLHAQIGGTRTYSFLNLPSTSRANAIGGNLITVKDADPGLAYYTPSLLNSTMHNKLSASTVIYFAGINFGNVNYVRHYDTIATTFQAGIQYITYGTFQETDVAGTETGLFSAGEFALNVGASRDYEKYTFGANFKFILSQLESYHSNGAALDLAASYNDTAKLFTATLLIRNIGFQFKPYYKGNREAIPFEIMAGFSKRFKHLPFRISVTFHDLQNFGIRYDDPDLQQQQNFLTGDTVESGSKVGDVFDEIGRHVILGGEFYFGKRMIVGFGYNHQRRQEMKFDTKKGLAGFSFGVVINIKQFSFGFSRARYHVAGASNHFTVGMNFNELVKRKQL